MRKLILLLILPLFLGTSCLKDGTNHIRYSGYIEVDSLNIPDTAMLGETIDVRAIGGAPNGCWSNLELIMQKTNDSLVHIVGTGVFETYDNLCTDVYQVVDSVFQYKPVDTGKIVFIGLSIDNKQIRDSLIVIPNSRHQ